MKDEIESLVRDARSACLILKGSFDSILNLCSFDLHLVVAYLVSKIEGIHLEVLVTRVARSREFTPRTAANQELLSGGNRCYFFLKLLAAVRLSLRSRKKWKEWIYLLRENKGILLLSS